MPLSTFDPVRHSKGVEAGDAARSRTSPPRSECVRTSHADPKGQHSQSPDDEAPAPPSPVRAVDGRSLPHPSHAADAKSRRAAPGPAKASEQRAKTSLPWRGEARLRPPLPSCALLALRCPVLRATRAGRPERRAVRARRWQDWRRSDVNDEPLETSVVGKRGGMTPGLGRCWRDGWIGRMDCTAAGRRAGSVLSCGTAGLRERVVA